MDLARLTGPRPPCRLAQRLGTRPCGKAVKVVKILVSVRFTQGTPKFPNGGESGETFHFCAPRSGHTAIWEKTQNTEIRCASGVPHLLLQISQCASGVSHLLPPHLA